MDVLWGSVSTCSLFDFVLSTRPLFHRLQFSLIHWKPAPLNADSAEQVCFYLCAFGCAYRVGGKEGGAFPLKHALLIVSQILRIYSISHSSLLPPYFCSVCHFLPAPLPSVLHLNRRHLSHAAAHICQTCIVSPLHWFPDQSGCCIFITAAAFCIFCLCRESGADRGGCMRSILAKSWSVLSLPASCHLILLPIVRMTVLLCSSYGGERMPFFFCAETFNVVAHYRSSRWSASLIVSELSVGSTIPSLRWQLSASSIMLACILLLFLSLLAYSSLCETPL